MKIRTVWRKQCRKLGGNGVGKLSLMVEQKSDNMVSYRSIQETEMFLNRIYEVMYQSLVHFLL